MRGEVAGGRRYFCLSTASGFLLAVPLFPHCFLAECTLASCEYLLSHLEKAPRKAEDLSGNLGHNRWAREPQIIADRFERFVAGLGHESL